MLHKKTSSSNYNQNTNEKLTKIGKNYKNRISICTILWNKITSTYKEASSIGIIKDKLPYYLFFDKKTVKRSKKEEITIKKAKN